MLTHVIIPMLHKRLPTEIKDSNEGQRKLLCSNKMADRCPSLDFDNDQLHHVKPIIKNLIDHLIEKEISNYLHDLYQKK
jgi:hypothetical protein